MISVTEANTVGVSKLVKDIEDGGQRVIMRNNQPVAALISFSTLEQLEEQEARVLDGGLAMLRLLTTEGDRSDLDEVLDRFGYTRDDLR